MASEIKVMQNSLNVKKDNNKRLSRQQKGILEVIWERTTYIEAHGNDFEKGMVECWGIPWYPAKGQEDWTRSDSAIISRALHRLEARGLLERNNDITNNRRRATRVKLTPAGIEVAKRLTK